MTAPASPDALNALRKSLAMAANDPGNVVRADGTKVGYKGDRCMGGWIADAIIAGPFAPVLASLQRVTAELDEARAKQRDMHRRAQKAESFRERHRGGFNYLMNGKRKERFGRRAAEDALATATAEAASLRAEVEALKGALTEISKETEMGLAPYEPNPETQVFEWRERPTRPAQIARSALARAAKGEQS